jgi:putative membrane protein
MRVACLLAGLGVLSLVWLAPLSSLLGGPFSAHMTRHMGLVALAAPLLALALAGSHWDPVRRWPALFPPIIASVVELTVVWAFHTPWLHHVARHFWLGAVIEQGSFLLSAGWLWLAAFGGDSVERGARAGSGVLALLLTSMHMTLLGALLALPPRPLFGHAAHQHSGGLTPLQDQHVGGAIMLVAGAIVYLLGGLWLAAHLLRRPALRRPEP